MFSKILNCCFFIFIVIMLTEAASTMYQEDSKIQICGDKITLLLENICDGFNTKTKKSTDTNDMIVSASEDNWLYGSNSPFINKMYAEYANTMTKTRRHRRGIVQECCHKICSYKEIVAYCY